MFEDFGLDFAYMVAGVMVFFVVVLIASRIRGGLGKKTRVIELFLDRTYEDKKIPFESNKLKPRKKDTVGFEPACVFSERTKKGLLSRPRVKGKETLILFVNGAKNALRFDKITDKLQPLWTKTEAKEFVHKEVAKAHEKHKPLTWTQFIVLLIPLGVIIFLLLHLCNVIGAF